MVGSRTPAVVAMLAMLGGCFEPTIGPGLVCQESGLCPAGLFCDDGICVEAPNGDLCGDGIVSGDEECDDGNTAAGDGCSADCATPSCLVPNTHPSIRAGLADATCPRLYIAPGIYHESVAAARDVEIEGVGLGDKVIDADAIATALIVGPFVVAIRNLTIRDGLAASGGGIVNEGTLVLENVTVTENRASGPVARGGGIFHMAGSLTLRATTIRDNLAEASLGNPTVAGGGGIYAEAPLFIEGESTIVGNIARANGPAPIARGGGVESVTASVEITDTLLEGNLTEAIAPAGVTGDATARGGALTVRDGVAVVTDATFRGNASVADSAADTTASASGGAIFAGDTEVTVGGSTFVGNRADATGERALNSNGGGIHMIGGSASFDGLALTENSSTGIRRSNSNEPGGASGAGLDLVNVAAVVIRRTAITDNVASVEAGTGAIGSAAATVRVNTETIATATISECDISRNKMTSSQLVGAAGLNISASTSNFTVRVESTTVSENEVEGAVAFGVGAVFAWNDGGVGIDAALDASFVNSTVSGNRTTAPAGGGALAVIAGTGQLSRVKIHNATVTANTTLSGGGGLGITNFTQDPAAIEITNSIFFGNMAADTSNDCGQGGLASLTSRHTFWGVVSCASLSSTNDTLGVDPLLGPLKDNGGQTFTHEPMAASPVLDAGDPAGCADDTALLATDQRGEPRPSNDRCDPGSVERQ